MSAKFFLDTNIFIYCFDPSSKRKKQIADQLVKSGRSSREGIISTQVIQEFLNVALTKFGSPMSIFDAENYLMNVLEPMCHVFPDTQLYRRALMARENLKVPFYDSLIVAGALEGGCTTLYTEDMQHGRRYQELTVVNPFE